MLSGDSRIELARHEPEPGHARCGEVVGPSTMDLRLWIATTGPRDWEGKVVVFVPGRLRHREAESSAWWWTEQGQKAVPESLFSVGVGGRVVRVRATDAELTPAEAQ